MSNTQLNQLTFVMDVDGVLSTGQFLYSSDGKAYKIFGPHDADGLKLLKDKLKIFFISGDKRGFPISQRRIHDMGLEVVFLSEQDRYGYLKQNVGMENLIFMGDGIYDAPIIKDCRFGIAPNGARKEAKLAAHFITESKAGEGAVLDACLEILKKFFKEGNIDGRV